VHAGARQRNQGAAAKQGKGDPALDLAWPVRQRRNAQMLRKPEAGAAGADYDALTRHAYPAAENRRTHETS
jgi:hypothetical protein